MNLLEIKNISKKYEKHLALQNVSLEIPKGTIFGLLGPNGAGKTTLIRIITQIIGADEGQIIFENSPLLPIHTEKMGYLPEERGLYKKMKVGEQLLYLAQLKGLKRAEAVKRLKVWFEKFDIKAWWNKNVQDLSKGMQQKIQFIATIIHEPSLIILDEPFTGFDPVNANLIKEEIINLKNKGTTIIFSTHRMESVEELCDNIALIHQSKKILAGKTRDIKNQFKTNAYEIEYIGNPIKEIPSYEIKEHKTIEEDLHRVVVQATTAETKHSLLSALLEKPIEIKLFQEKIPSMNDIFIRLVS